LNVLLNTELEGGSRPVNNRVCF